MISLEKWKILTPLQKMPKNVGNLRKIIAATGFEKLSKVQKIAQSGHTDCRLKRIFPKYLIHFDWQLTYNLFMRVNITFW